VSIFEVEKECVIECLAC